jgi:hypothetical protein
MASHMKVPPCYPLYSEKNELYNLMQCMMEEILVKQPSDPIQCLIEFLSRDDSSGKYALSEIGALF